MKIKIQLISYICAMVGASVLPAYSASLFSKYGVIQNVQDYSLNPSWNSNSPYNNRLPTPVYALGPDIGTDDCMRIVSDLIGIYCSGINNCANATLSDIRPVIMLQLSRISTGNYATSCGGYIDVEFEKYAQAHGNVKYYTNATFPAPAGTTTAPNIQIDNPYQPQIPDWASDIQKRKQQLDESQQDNNIHTYAWEHTEFPTTYADLSFTDRMNNEKTGYAPYKDNKAYDYLKVETLKEYENRQSENIAGALKAQTDAPAIIEKAQAILNDGFNCTNDKTGEPEESQPKVEKANQLFDGAKILAQAAIDLAKEARDLADKAMKDNDRNTSILANGKYNEAKSKLNEAQNKITQAKNICRKPTQIPTPGGPLNPGRSF